MLLELLDEVLDTRLLLELVDELLLDVLLTRLELLEVLLLLELS